MKYLRLPNLPVISKPLETRRSSSQYLTDEIEMCCHLSVTTTNAVTYGAL